MYQTDGDRCFHSPTGVHEWHTSLRYEGFMWCWDCNEHQRVKETVMPRDPSGMWTDAEKAARKADPKANDPNNWAVNPQLDEEDEAALAKVDAEMVQEAQSKSMTKRIAEQARKDVSREMTAKEAPERLVSDGDDGGIEVYRGGKRIM